MAMHKLGSQTWRMGLTKCQHYKNVSLFTKGDGKKNRNPVNLVLEPTRLCNCS